MFTLFALSCEGQFVAQLIVLASTSLGGPKVRACVISLSGFVSANSITLLLMTDLSWLSVPV